MCTICEKSAWGEWQGLVGMDVDAPKYPGGYLLRCPSCGAYWMGNGFAPQIMLEFSAAEAAEVFPELGKAGPPHS